MCGICGVVYRTGEGPVERDLLEGMTRTLVHRGPDEDGFFLDERVGLGMRRLRVIDLITGSQPVHNEDRTVWVVYNGEIYNFRTLREELIGLGHTFRTRSDTEVLVHLYEQWGLDGYERLNGMFGCAIWDGRSGRLTLMRDRMGVKPLYYAELPTGLVFGSEPRAILTHPAVNTDIDLEALADFFVYQYVPGPRSIFRAIRKLPAGSALTWTDGALSVRRLWHLPWDVPEQGPGPEHFHQEIRRSLTDSIRRRLQSDVPLGVLLSGGIDSSTLVALARRSVQQPIQTFTLGFGEKNFDESDFAREVADHFGTEHHHLLADPVEMVDTLGPLLAHMDEPLADPSLLPTFLVTRFARQGVTVALAGDGGDELFGGYTTYHAHRIAGAARRIPPRVIRTLQRALALTGSADRDGDAWTRLAKFLKGLPFPAASANTIWRGLYAPGELDGLLSRDVKAALHGYDPLAKLDDILAACPARGLVDRMAYLDLRLYLSDGLLVKTDRMSMANSLEVRVPFLDPDVIRVAASIPAPLKVKGTGTKLVLRGAMRELLPSRTLGRGKQGFDTPLARWMKGPLREFVLDHASPNRVGGPGLFDHRFVERILTEFYEGKENHRDLIWPLVVFEVWRRRWVEGR